MYSSLENF